MHADPFNLAAALLCREGKGFQPGVVRGKARGKNGAGRVNARD
jgi:hypothetical protein